MSGFLRLSCGKLLREMMIFQILEIGSWKWVMVIGIVGLAMVGIEVRWVVVRVQGSRWRWGEGGQR